MDDLLASLPYCGLPPIPAGIWSRWNVDPILIAVLLAAFAWHARYLGVVGSSRWSAARLPSSKLAVFYGGWFALAVALLSPICALSVSLFSARVSQHMWLIAVAAPLLALASTSADVKRRPRSIAPFTAAGLFAIALWIWHWPALYARTFTSDVVYWLMHVSMTGSAILLWRSLLVPLQAHALTRVVAGFVTLVHMGLLGALITFAPRALYAPHFLTAPTWNLTALEDQQLGGLIMWIPASGVFLVVALVTVYGILRESDVAQSAS